MLLEEVGGGPSGQTVGFDVGFPPYMKEISLMFGLGYLIVLDVASFLF